MNGEMNHDTAMTAGSSDRELEFETIIDLLAESDGTGVGPRAEAWLENARSRLTTQLQNAPGARVRAEVSQILAGYEAAYELLLVLIGRIPHPSVTAQPSP